MRCIRSSPTLSRVFILLMLLAIPACASAETKQRRWSVAFSCDSSLVASCGDRVRIHDLQSGELLREIEGERTEFLAFSPVEPDLFAVADAKKIVRVWRLNDEAPLRVFDQHEGYLGSVAFDTSGKYVASTSSQGDPFQRNFGQLRVREIETGKLVHSSDIEKGKLHGISFSADGKLAALCRFVKGDASFIDVYQMPQWKRIDSIKISAGKQLEENEWGKAVPKGLVTKFTPDIKHILVAGGICVHANPHGYSYACKPTMVLWRVDLEDSSATKLCVDAERAHCHALDLINDGTQVVYGNGVIETRDVGDGKLLWNSSYARGVAVSADGKYIAGGSTEGLLILLAQSGKTVRMIKSEP